MADRGDTAPTKNGPDTPCPPAKHEKTPQLHPFTNQNFPGTPFWTTWGGGVSPNYFFLASKN